MGYFYEATTTRARRRALIAATLAFSLLAAFLTAATPARAVELGVSDSKAQTLDEPFWAGLNVNRIRVVLPFDVVNATGDAGRRRREDFETLRTAANARGALLHVSFAASADVRSPSGEALAPTVEEFDVGFRAFRERYPEVVEISPWNEPNNPDGRTYPLAADPVLAANLWLRAQAICPSCTIVAGDFAGIAGDDAYVDAYQATLLAAGAIPRVWAFHDHGDVNSFQSDGPDSARVARYFISKLQGPWAGGRIWINEVGARFRDASGAVLGDDSQQLATQFLLGLGTLDPRIDAIYYYNYSNGCNTAGRCAIQDRGLLSPTPVDGSPLDYDTPNRPRAAYGVFAARGPVIVPAQLVPPVVTIDTPAQAQAVNRRTPDFNGQAATGGRAAATVQLQIFSGISATQSSAPLQTGTGTVTGGRWAVRAASLPDGAYTARATQVGNPSSSGISVDTAFTVDTVPPTTRFLGVPPALTGAHSATVTFVASEPGATFACSVDRAPWTPCTAPLKLSRLRLGTHTLRVRATDVAGNVQRRPSVATWRVVSLQTALLPRTASLGDAVSLGLPVSTACADSCRVDARLYMPRAAAQAAGLAFRSVSRRDPARPRGAGYVVVGGAKLVRPRAGSGALALRVRAASSGALAATSSLAVRAGFTLTPKGSKPTAISRAVTLVRSGPLRGLPERGLPITLACSSPCSARTAMYVSDRSARALRAPGGRVSGTRANGLPRGSYAALGERVVSRTKAGGSDVTIALDLPRAAVRRLTRLSALGLRTSARTRGAGSAAAAYSLPLTLPR
ncbi:hypothetical protein VSS74_17880 [Conexibacter stalactiti]|uniref:Bacterial Ig-like domain-containing protein n=1 Tax=Conexibacter stalactiti TaxID=1940611 RepID=A0ABU4HSC3_9ACTN|nr:hypothetical protein [Conexibacter stalactiti]MDW5596223.1 hypothetical protein [Conexibacter stalactiti]MEC5036865.1 hypothetical protein [Conexibacter stalactiti]